MQVRNRIAAVLLLGALGVAGCASTPAEFSLVGTWDVVSVDGQALSVEGGAEEDDGYPCTTALYAMQMTFSADGTMTMMADHAEICPGEEPERETTRLRGTWSLDGNTLTTTLAGADPAESEIAVSGSTITLTDADPDGDAPVLVMRRR